MAAPREKKESFLQSKGLSNEEIAIAFDKSSFGYNQQSQGLRPVLTVQPLTPFQKFREILHTIALFTGVSYGIYYFFKVRIRNFFVRNKYIFFLEICYTIPVWKTEEAIWNWRRYYWTPKGSQTNCRRFEKSSWSGPSRFGESSRNSSWASSGCTESWYY